MKAKLVVVGGTTETTEVDLHLPAIIGRGRSALITVPHALVSRQHCELVEQDGKLVVRDLGSLNGTYVADQRVTEAVLEPGGLLTVGTVTFRAVYNANDDGAEDTADEIEAEDSTLDEAAGEEETTQLVPEASVSAILPPQLKADAGANDSTIVTDVGKSNPTDSADDALDAFLNKRK
jgi:predicted component of type VI protein secretion system